MLSVLMNFGARIRIQPSSVAGLVLAVAVLVCLGGLASPAMAGSMSQDCVGPACDDQIGCNQPAQPQVSSGFSIHLVVLPAAVPHGVVLPKAEARSGGPPPLRVTWSPFTPVAPRSPPVA
jgi:hypothetical protein